MVRMVAPELGGVTREVAMVRMVAPELGGGVT